MLGTIGHSFVLLGCACASCGIICGYWAGFKRDARMFNWSSRLIYLFSFAMLVANGVMVYALLIHDFSISYVAQVGSRSTPTLFTIASLWSSLEGSILFWGLILSAYISLFNLSYRGRYRAYMPFALGTLHIIGLFFALLISGPANPFEPVFPVPTDGPGPNALLQNHVLMLIHPPTLYLGYVGMSVPFAIAVAALLKGELAEGWLKPLRQWTLIPWSFLTVGIILGGWWAYEVLGWGGYWAWDPVENASFLPWLVATAYLHSTIVQERKKILKVWTLSLVLSAFLLTILGTFMTRSGVFNSVHSFTQSSIGPTFLVFLALMLIFSVGLLAGRSHLLESEGRVGALLSRESAFLLNNLVFAVFTFTVLLGTVFPLLTEAFKGVQVSVGEPYFNKMAVPLGLILVFLMGIGPVLPWGQPRIDALIKRFLVPLGIGILAVLGGWFLGMSDGMVLFTFLLVGFASSVSFIEMFAPAFTRAQERQEAYWPVFWRMFKVSRRHYGGHIVHLAVFILVTAIAVSQTYRTSVEASLTKGESMRIDDYVITYKNTEGRQEPHRFSVGALVEVTKGDVSIGEMSPKLNYYQTQREPIGTPAVKTMLSEDLYLSLLSFEKDRSRVAIKAYVLPLVVWIWLTIPLFILGACIAFWPKPRRTQALKG
jgi:cytochrome c-type biogenesis protein CcmF